MNNLNCNIAIIITAATIDLSYPYQMLSLFILDENLFDCNLQPKFSGKKTHDVWMTDNCATLGEYVVGLFSTVSTRRWFSGRILFYCTFMNFETRVILKINSAPKLIVKKMRILFLTFLWFHKISKYSRIRTYLKIIVMLLYQLRDFLVVFY